MSDQSQAQAQPKKAKAMAFEPLVDGLEAAAHEEFGVGRPSEDALVEFIRNHFPKMLVGELIAAAALMLQGWQLWRSERDRQKGGNGGPHCPKCNKPAIARNKRGRLKCINGHTWRPSRKPK